MLLHSSGGVGNILTNLDTLYQAGVNIYSNVEALALIMNNASGGIG